MPARPVASAPVAPQLARHTRNVVCAVAVREQPFAPCRQVRLLARSQPQRPPRLLSACPPLQCLALLPQTTPGALPSLSVGILTSDAWNTLPTLVLTVARRAVAGALQLAFAPQT